MDVYQWESRGAKVSFESTVDGVSDGKAPFNVS